MTEDDAIPAIDPTTGVNGGGIGGDIGKIVDPSKIKNEEAFEKAVLSLSIIQGASALNDILNSSSRDTSSLLENAEVGAGG